MVCGGSRNVVSAVGEGGELRGLTEVDGPLVLPAADATVEGTVDVEVLELGDEPAAVCPTPVSVTAVSADAVTGIEVADVLESDEPLQAPPARASNPIATAAFRSTGSLSPLAAAINPHPTEKASHEIS